MESLQQAVDLAGGQAQLARGIRERVPGSKISQPHVYKWLNSPNPDQMPPAEVVLAMADFLEYRMTPHELRADLYPNPSDGMPANRLPAAKPCQCLDALGEPRSGIDRREGARRQDDQEAAA